MMASLNTTPTMTPVAAKREKSIDLKSPTAVFTLQLARADKRCLGELKERHEDPWHKVVFRLDGNTGGFRILEKYQHPKSDGSFRRGVKVLMGKDDIKVTKIIGECAETHTYTGWDIFEIELLKEIELLDDSNSTPILVRRHGQWPLVPQRATALLTLQSWKDNCHLKNVRFIKVRVNAAESQFWDREKANTIVQGEWIKTAVPTTTPGLSTTNALETPRPLAPPKVDDDNEFPALPTFVELEGILPQGNEEVPLSSPPPATTDVLASVTETTSSSATLGGTKFLLEKTTEEVQALNHEKLELNKALEKLKAIKIVMEARKVAIEARRTVLFGDIERLEKRNRDCLAKLEKLA